MSPYNEPVDTSTADTPDDYDIAIIGGGASGVLVALHLLHQATAPLRIAMIEPDPVLARGVAYATDAAEHLLNVPTRRMSAFDSRPDDFIDYRQAHAGEPVDRDVLAADFAPRRQFGDYLRDRLQQARAQSPAQIEHRCAEAMRVAPDPAGLLVELADGRHVRARHGVVAVGNRPRPLPARGNRQLPARQVHEAWDHAALRSVPTDAEVCILGTGLSMVDAVLSLEAQGHRGRIHVLSRHGLMPLPHARQHASSPLVAADLFDLSLRQRFARVRSACRALQAQGQPWQAVLESLRPDVRAVWQSLSPADQRRFLRHGKRHWDIHRHRIAPQVHARLQALRERGQLQGLRGRLDTLTPAGERLRLCLHGPRGPLPTLDADVVINATGLEMRVQAMRNPLLVDLLGHGHARPGPHGIGLKTAADGRLSGDGLQPDLPVYVLGSLRIGDLWESIAIPDLRQQAAGIAGRLLATLVPAAQ